MSNPAAGGCGCSILLALTAGGAAAGLVAVAAPGFAAVLASPWRLLGGLALCLLLLAALRALGSALPDAWDALRRRRLVARVARGEPGALASLRAECQRSLWSSSALAELLAPLAGQGGTEGDALLASIREHLAERDRHRRDVPMGAHGWEYVVAEQGGAAGDAAQERAAQELSRLFALLEQAGG